MPNLIRPAVTHVITKDGEVQVSITIDLNLNLTTGGIITASADVEATPLPKKKEEEDLWEIPSFKSGGKLKFGKQVEE